MGKKIKTLLSSIVAIALSAGLTVGGTFALLTDEKSVNVAVTMANVEVEASIGDISVKQGSACTAKVENGELIITLMAPGDEISFDINIQNKSNIAVEYKIAMDITPVEDATPNVKLTDVLTATANIDGVDYAVKNGTGMDNFVKGDIPDKIAVKLTFPNGTAEHDNLYKNEQAKITFTVQVQQSINNN